MYEDIVKKMVGFLVVLIESSARGLGWNDVLIRDGPGKFFERELSWIIILCEYSSDPSQLLWELLLHLCSHTSSLELLSPKINQVLNTTTKKNYSLHLNHNFAYSLVSFCYKINVTHSFTTLGKHHGLENKAWYQNDQTQKYSEKAKRQNDALWAFIWVWIRTVEGWWRWKPLYMVYMDDVSKNNIFTSK